MEKRSCKRRPVLMNAEIYYHGNLLVSCHLKDISLCGAGLQTGPLTFFRNSEIKLRLIDFNSTVDSNFIKGIVVRNSANETGVVFTLTKPNMINSILKHTIEVSSQLSTVTRH